MNIKIKKSLFLSLNFVILLFAIPVIAQNKGGKVKDGEENSEVISWSKFKGKAKIFSKYQYVDDFQDNLAVVSINGKSGFVDRNGREVVSPKYSEAYGFSEGLAGVRVGDEFSGKTGFIDKTGREVIPLKYDAASPFSEGLAAVSVKGKKGYIDKTGQLIIPLKYDSDFSFIEGLAKVFIRDGYYKKCGFIDKTGREVIPLKYDEAYSFSEGLAAVRVRTLLSVQWGFIDKTGKEIIPLKYDDVTSFSEGLAGVIEGNPLDGSRWGFIDKTGEQVIAPLFMGVDDFRNGLAVVRIANKYGIINRSKRVIVSPQYDLIGSFNEKGLAEIYIGNLPKFKSGYIDKTGKVVIKPIYDGVWCISLLNEGFIGLMRNGKKAFVSIEGKEYLKFKDF